jgi:ankyrin repeat protein
MEVVTYLVSRGADVNAKGPNDLSVLHCAAQNSGNIEVLSYLILQGADVNAVSSGCTPLHRAAQFNRRDAISKCLVQWGADVNAKEEQSGNTPLHLAARYNSNSAGTVLKYLLSVPGIDVNPKNNDGQTPLDVANTSLKQRVLRTAGGITTTSGRSTRVSNE